MRESIALRQALRDSIADDIAKRTIAHQTTITRLETFRQSLGAAAVPLPPEPLVMLANGDSWFDYPLSGNALSLRSTDIIAQLSSLGSISPAILNVAHFGDATTVEMSLAKQQRMIEALQDHNNWLSSGKPDAILFSGGGDDIAGNQFCIFLNYALPGATGLNLARFQGVLDMIKASYLDLFVFRDRYATGVPIFAHCYDYPIPNGVHPDCAGPWLQPSLDYCGWNVTQGTAIVRTALVEFKDMLDSLAKDPANNFTVVQTQGLLNPIDWANELHPEPEGFQTIATAFIDALKLRFPSRI